MKIENLEKANEIQKRMKELEKVKAWMEDEGRKECIHTGSGIYNE